jgi:hypothetical protein
MSADEHFDNLERTQDLPLRKYKKPEHGFESDRQFYEKAAKLNKENVLQYQTRASRVNSMASNLDLL